MTRYQVTAVNPENAHQWEQKILRAESEEDAKRVMVELLPESRKQWRITWVGEVDPCADENGSLHGD